MALSVSRPQWQPPPTHGQMPEPIQALLQTRLAWAGGLHVLEEAQLAAGPQHAAQLAQRALRIGHRAEHQARDRGVERAVLEWKRVRDCAAHRHRHGRPARRLLGLASQERLGLQRDDLADRRRIVLEVHPVAGADLDDPS